MDFQEESLGADCSMHDIELFGLKIERLSPKDLDDIKKKDQYDYERYYNLPDNYSAGEFECF